jgi:hypothetical protein
VSIDYLLMVTAILFSLTICTTFLYYRRIRLASVVYEEAKSVVADIVISFERQLQRQEAKIENAIQKIEAATGKSESLSKHFEEQEKTILSRLDELRLRVDIKPANSSDEESLKKEVRSLKRQLESLFEAQRELEQQEGAIASDSQVETVIPIKKERALAPLTETELRVLEFIAAEGEKTAPQIRDFIKLTREHTARLMKKLYQQGYVERRSDKAPYIYRIKEEMLKILRKREVNG